MRLSLPAKCVLIVAAAALGVLAIAAMTIGEIFFEGKMAQWHQHSAGALQNASDRIVGDPRPRTIEALAKRLGVDIAYSGPRGGYRTSDDLPDPALLDIKEIRKSQRRMPHMMSSGLLAFRHRGGLYFMRVAGRHRVLYGLAHGNELWEDIPAVLLGALLALVLLFAAVALLLRRLLRPLREVAGKMSEVGENEGEKVTVSHWLDDEVAQLVRNFNSMRGRVAGMLKSKETLLRDVSHEVRSPLARLRVALEFVADAKLRAQMLEDIGTIDNLAGELLERARLEDGTRPLAVAEVELADLVRETVASYPDENQKHFALDLPAEGLQIKADARLLSRALGNIINNSLKYSELAPGSIQVILRTAGSGEGKQAVLEVADQGPRIPATVVGRLFESFYRADGARTHGSGGFGLGLTIVASIARAHGGETGAIAPENGGLRCQIRLPAD